MLDIEPSLVTALGTATSLPVYNENFITSKTTMPCITYMIADDIQSKKGTTLGYSEIYYYIKVWAKKESVIQTNALLIDGAMRGLGFTRMGTTELWNGGIGQKQIRYKALGLETFNN